VTTQKDPTFAQFFPDPLTWKNDLVAVGGDFSVERLLYAYTHGIFPWSENPIRWYSLDPRAIFNLSQVHFSKTVLRKVKKNIYRISINEAFPQVMRSCAVREKDQSWITKGFFEGYEKLHSEGWAHSIEAWSEDLELVGGVYGVAIGKFFAGESMFAFAPDAGKVALFHLFEKLNLSQFQLFDTQQLNQVTWSLGAYEIRKADYLQRLQKALGTKEKWLIPQ
jgi:leucyl/phenylalanyl-tRNA---protein transferase